MNNPEGTHTDIEDRKTFSETLKGKTLKREVAGGFIVVWLWMLYRLLVIVPSTDIPIYLPLFTAASAPMWVFILGAFGLDHMKKMKNGA